MWTISATTKTSSRAPVSYLREDGTADAPERLSAGGAVYNDNAEVGAYAAGPLEPTKSARRDGWWSRACALTGTRS